MDERIVLGLVISAFVSMYAVVAAMLGVIAYLIKEKRLIPLALTSPGIQYLWALCALGIAAALANGNKMGVPVAMLLAVFFLIGAFVRSVMTRKLFDKIIEVSCAASLFAFAVAFVQYLTNGAHSARISSTFYNANYYAAAIEIVTLFAVYKLLHAKNRKQSCYYAAVAVFNAIGLYFSGCRTAVFALCVAATLMLVLCRSYKALCIHIGLCAGLAAIMFALPNLFPRMGQLDVDISTRIHIWRYAIASILQSPIFGKGALAFMRRHIIINHMHIMHTHSIYLEILLSFGLLGAGLVLAYLKNCLAPIWRMRRIGSDRDRFALAFALLGCIGLHGLVDATVFSIQAGLLMMLLFSLAGVQENHRRVTLPAHRPAYLPAARIRENYTKHFICSKGHFRIY